MAGYPVSIIGHFKLAAHPTAIDDFIHLSTGAGDSNSHRVGTTATDNLYRGQTFDSAAGSNTVNQTIDVDGIWASFAYICASTTDRRFYLLDIANVDSSANSRTFSTTLDTVHLGTHNDLLSDAVVNLAEIAVFAAELDTTQITNALAGFLPTFLGITPELYYSMGTDTGGTIPNDGSDATGDLTVTSGAAYDADHPVMTGPGGLISPFGGKLSGLIRGPF